jgi:hypothetical protein
MADSDREAGLVVTVASYRGVVLWRDNHLFYCSQGIGYHDSRNSGLVGAPFYSLTIGLFVLVGGVVIAAIVLFWRRCMAGMLI